MTVSDLKELAAETVRGYKKALIEGRTEDAKLINDWDMLRDFVEVALIKVVADGS